MSCSCPNKTYIGVQKSMASVSKKKCRQYSVEYLDYGFIESPQNSVMPMCLICKASMSNERKPHTIGESLIMTAVAIVLSKVMKQSPQEVTSVIPLSNCSVSRRIDEVATDVESQLVLKLLNIVACTTDGAAAMIGRYRGFSAYSKNAVPNVISLYCVVHRLHLVAKNLAGRLHEALGHIIKAVNLIKKNALQDRLFHVISFLSKTELGQKLVDAKSDTLYLSDIFEKLNFMSKELQGNDSTLCSCMEAVTAFIGKLKLFWLNLGRWEFAQFPSLASISTEVLDVDLAVHVDHLKQLHNDMATRFSDLLQMTVPDWFVDPFIADASEVDVTLQESVIELQNDTTARGWFKRGGRHKLWIYQDVHEKYPLLWKKVKLILLAFPTSYLVETGFSRVMHLLSKTRNRLDIEKKGRFTSFSDIS
ncbi:protein FAM200C-like [Oratosquilla oratoria]|uniref:protein FAM200C-like n=1 Tax=Oratosquilla oratoria TaxID=337810 RepID=UPI003F770DF1